MQTVRPHGRVYVKSKEGVLNISGVKHNIFQYSISLWCWVSWYIGIVTTLLFR